MAFVAYGKQTIASAGTIQQLAVPAITANVAAQMYTQQITIQAAPTGNTGNIYVGDSTMVVSSGVGVAFILAGGQSVTIPAQGGSLHPNGIYLDGTTNSNVAYASAVTK